MKNNPEKVNVGPERERSPGDLEQVGVEQREKLQQELERTGEKKHEDLEEVRHEALERATSIKHEKNSEERPTSPVERRKDGPISKAELETSFDTTMKEAQTHMSTPSRAFSKVIHNKTIEEVSDIAGNTLARPNAILTGAIFAFFLTLGVYLIAKNLGYPLSGFETIGAYILGWIIGLVYDFLKVMVTGRK